MKTLKEARIKIGLTQKQVAEQAGISLTAYQGYERGERTPRVDAIQKMSGALKIDPGELYYPSDDGRVTFLKDTQETVDTIQNISHNVKKSEDYLKKAKHELNVIFDGLNTKGKLEAFHRISELKKVPEYTQPDVEYRDAEIDHIDNVPNTLPNYTPESHLYADDVDPSLLFDISGEEKELPIAQDLAKKQEGETGISDLLELSKGYNLSPQIMLNNKH